MKLAPKTLLASKICGTGSAFPETVLTNQELAQAIDTTDEWIVERTGIQERRISKPGVLAEENSSLGAAASLRAMEMAGIQADEIDLILYGTCTPDTLIPSTACWLQRKIGAKRAWAMDINAACSGFVYALATANQFIQTGQAKTALVVGADTLSSFTNWTDRTSCILFADGAGAAVVKAVEPESQSRILSHHLHSDGTQWDLFHIPAGGSKLEVTPEVHAQKLDKMQMKGKEIFKVAVRTLTHYAQLALQENDVTLKDLNWFISHQANLRVIEAVAKQLKFPMEQVLFNIQKFGNTSSATVPTVLDEGIRSGKIKSGDLVLLDVFGAGLTNGSLLLRW